MFNKKIIRNFSAVILTITILSIFTNGLTFPNSEKAKATIIPTSSPISSTTVYEDNGTIESSVVSDMDDNGNQIYAWAFREFITGNDCRGIRYQKFQMSGLPLTSKTNVTQSCVDGENLHQYIQPSVTSDRLGNFVIAWTDINPASSNHLKAVAFNNNNLQRGAELNVDDTGTSINESTGPSVAIKKDDAETLTHFAVSWIGCNATPNCASSRLEEKAQIYTVDFTSNATPNKVNLSNLVLNSSPYEVLNDSVPTIAFSRNNFLIAWAGYHTTNSDANWNIFSRTVNVSGVASPNISQISNFSSREHHPSLTGIYRPNSTFGTSDNYYLSFSSSYLSSNSDIYAEKIICSSILSNCNSTFKANGDPIFVRVNTSTSGDERLSTIKAFTNSNRTDKTFETEYTSSDYFNVTWCSYDSVGDVSKIYSQNFKNDLARAEGEITIEILKFTDCPTTPSVAMDNDGNYSISTINASAISILIQTFQSLYLRKGAETLVHAPSSQTQSNPKTAINSNGNYIITYQSPNSSEEIDVMYALYDKNGNAIKNVSIANDSTIGDHYDQDVTFFNEDPSSLDYGKFIISWTYYDYSNPKSVHYQVYNADGTKIGGPTIVSSNNASNARISAGKYAQFLISYIEDNLSLFSVKYLYKNNTDSISGSANDVDNNTLNSPVAILSPDADGSFGISGKSNFVIGWNDGTESYWKEGYLTSSTTLNLNSVQSAVDKNITDSSAAIVPLLGTLTPAKNSFMYAFTSNDADSNGYLTPYSFGDGPLLPSPISLGGEGTQSPRVAIDKGSGNLLVSWTGFNEFANQINLSQVLMFTKNSGTNLYVFDHVIGATSTAEADITFADSTNPVYQINNATAPFNFYEDISTTRSGMVEGNLAADVIGVVKAQFFRLNFSQPFDNSTWLTKFGPEFSPNTYFNYGQLINSPDMDFDSRSSSSDGKIAIFSYQISGDNTYLDSNGILQQRIEDPFAYGQKEDVSPLTDQQILSGGKYIVVPQLIDFGTIARGATGTVNFSDLTMPDSSPGRIEVTNLDFGGYDLTVSLSTLTNTVTPTATIPSSNFIIENNDGTHLTGENPGVTTNYSFTNVNDLILDSSTAPGMNANLATPQTVARQVTNNSGVHNFYPRVILTMPPDAANGTYSATLTFTLI